MNITIKTIPHSKQRYETVGDWWFDGNNTLQVRVSKMNNIVYEFLVGIHECIEAFVCKQNGIKETTVTKFDMQFEKNRKEGDISEPGDDTNAPYRPMHFFATSIERIISQALGVDWDKYEDKVNLL